jgi:hypothetical protein
MNWGDRIVVDTAVKASPQLTADDVKAGLKFAAEEND